MAIPNDITLFRGLAGEVICGFLRPRIFLTLVPVWFYWGLFGVIGALMGNATHPLAMQALLLLGLAALVGRFALPASRGDLDAGFFDFNENIDSGELISFGVRYLVAVMFWAIPTLVVVVLILKFQDVNGLEDITSARTGLAAITMIGSSVISFLGSATSVIIATGTSSTSETLQLKHWSYVLLHRRADFVSFLAAVFGGIATFCLVYAVPFVTITYILSLASPELGGIFAAGAILAPLSISPVLIGRLAGAFILGEEEITGREMELAVKNILAAAPRRSSGYSGKPIVPVNPGFQEATGDTTTTLDPAAQWKKTGAHAANIEAGDFIRKLQRIKKEELPKELEVAATHYALNKLDLNAAFKYMLLLRKTGDDDTASSISSTSIKQSLKDLDWASASIFFRSMQQLRTKLQLDADHFQSLAQHFESESKFEDAAWCSSRGGQKDGKAGVELQRSLIALAESASAASKHSESAKIYRQILEEFPQSNFADYIQKQLTIEESMG